MNTRHQQRGALLLEMIFALAIFIAAATTVLLIQRSGVAAVRHAINTQRAIDHAASAIAQIEAGLASAQQLTGPIPRYSAGTSESAFANAPPEPTNWSLEIESERSDITGLLILTVTARFDTLAGAGNILETASSTTPPSTGYASLRALVRLDRAQPDEDNPDDALQQILDQGGPR